MQTGICEKGHQVWWCEFEGERTAMVKVRKAYRIDEFRVNGGGLEAIGVPMAPLYQLHSDVCPSRRFYPDHQMLEEGKRRAVGGDGGSCP